MLLNHVEPEEKQFEDYKTLIENSLYAEIKNRSQRLAGLKIAQLNAAASGGGVVELLRSFIPLLNDLGIKTDWYTLSAPTAFFEITKKMHNFLQGGKGKLTQEEKDFYFKYNCYFAEEMKEIKTDLWVIHDPQPAAIILYGNPHPLIWRCHLDTSESNNWIQGFFSFLKDYDKYIFSLPQYAFPDLDKRKVAIFPPAIDPFTPKNQPLDSSLAEGIMAKLGVNPSKPIITQVSRFDPWKDPLGVIEAYQLAKKEISDLQLILTGEMAADDPEGQRILEDVKKVAGSDPDIHLWADEKRDDLKINAVQVASDIILQKSLKEGFGLTVTEAMWKGKVVIGGNCGGIKFQIKDGKNGFLVNSPEEAAQKIIWTLKNPEKAEIIGQRAKKTVRKNFLIPRLLNDALKLFEELLAVK
ncbi:glycosyltransferase [Candidatus Microgenomates bacterium]|nr:glycosyltransferase [Candidatus Microgenomates bacterium]